MLAVAQAFQQQPAGRCFSLLPGTWRTSDTTPKKGASVAEGWSVSASGTMAQAMEAEVAQGSGLASVRCGEPGSDIWFVGPGQQNGASQIQLDLMNIDSLAASVDVAAPSPTPARPRRATTPGSRSRRTRP